MSGELTSIQRKIAKYSRKPSTSGIVQSSLDIVFIFDTTGSMYRYLDKVRNELARLASEVCKAILDVKIGVVAYGDYCDANSTYVTKVLDLTSDFQQVKSFISQVERTGGGDTPEAVEEALFDANTLAWRVGSKRAIVLVGDAPPHGVVDTAPKRDYKAEGRSLSRKGIKIYATQCGRDSDAESAFRWLASETEGTYLSLENIDDLVDLLIGVCMKEVGLLEAYADRLASQNRLTGSKAKMLKQLKGSSNG